MSNAYEHMEEAWGFEENPFPQAAISSGSTEPYSPEVFPAETLEFQTKVIRGALQGASPMAFLWSRGRGGDTGFGKTALMHHTVSEINEDWGRSIELGTGMKPDRVVPIAAGFSELNTLTRTGMYPVLFNAVLGMAADSKSPLIRARARIADAVEDDSPTAIRNAVTAARLEHAPTSSALRPDVLEVFCDAIEELPGFLGEVSNAGQVRNGIQYLNLALIIFAAAGVRKVFLMIDQLEDLATNKSLPAAKRRREIGRIRDLMETEPFASMLHQSFTFHATAAADLETFWEAHRLPSFEDNASNQGSVVVLRGMQDDDQVEKLLQVWMEPCRDGSVASGSIAPFEREVLTILRDISQGRPGLLLRFARELFIAGAEAQVAMIDANFAKDHLRGVRGEEDPMDEQDYADDVTDLLA
jgi:hypothetical protein